MEVGLSIAQMQRGMDVEGFYLLKAAFAKVTASGKPFLSAVLADTSGTIEAKVWDYSGPIGERDVGKAHRETQVIPLFLLKRARYSGACDVCVSLLHPALAAAAWRRGLRRRGS